MYVDRYNSGVFTHFHLNIYLLKSQFYIQKPQVAFSMDVKFPGIVSHMFHICTP